VVERGGVGGWEVPEVVALHFEGSYGYGDGASIVWKGYGVSSKKAGRGNSCCMEMLGSRSGRTHFHSAWEVDFGWPLNVLWRLL
jgi:hypothetical protein